VIFRWPGNISESIRISGFLHKPGLIFRNLGGISFSYAGRGSGDKELQVSFGVGLGVLNGT